MISFEQETLAKEVESLVKQDKVYTPEENAKIMEYWNNWGSSYIDYYSKHLYSLSQDIANINKWASNGAYNPPTGQDYTQDINITPTVPTVENIKSALKNPAKNQKELRNISQYLENNIMQYKRTTDYIAKILTMKNDMRALDIPKRTDSMSLEDSKKTWKNGYDRCNRFLRKFNQQYQFGIVLQKISSEGGMFTYLEENENFATLVEIPSDYCYITGRWDYGWTYAIDLVYYDNLIGLIRVTPELTKYYERFIAMREAGLRGNKLAPYQYYPVPVEKGYVFTHNPLRAQIVPPMTGTFLDASAILDYKNLMKSKVTLDTIAIIAQEIPMDNEGKPSIDVPIAQQIIAATSTILGKQTATFATPFKVKPLEFNSSQNQNNWVGYGENEYWRTSGIGSSIMDMTDSNAQAQKYSVMNDYGFMEHIYRQFENFINIQLYLKSKEYRFRVSYYGNRYTESEEIKDYASLVATQNMPVGKLYGLVGYEPYEVDGVINMEEILGWRKVEPITSANQKSSADQGGRPRKDLGDMTDSGVNQAGYDSNATAGK